MKEKAGFLGLGNNRESIIEQVPVERRPYYEPLAQLDGQKSEACIEAVGGGKQTGKMVGASVGAAVAPSVASIPFVGWVLAGAATMIGMDAGSDVGGTMVESISKEC